MERVIDNILLFKRRCRIEEELAGRLSLTAREATLLCALEKSGSLRAGDLARQVDLSPSRLSRLLSSLKRQDMIAWREDERDRRALDVELTVRGRAACEEIKKAKLVCEQRLRSRLSPAQLQIVSEGLSLLIRAL